ncbi:MAG: hypothetical protein KAR13_20045, partial [Desulfobulbaceae bacterium]|nr:hypothetical protein [Desulfobulbaceae bacterium]
MMLENNKTKHFHILFSRSNKMGAALLGHRLTTISVVIIFLIFRQSYLITLRWPPLKEDCGSFVG